MHLQRELLRSTIEAGQTNTQHRLLLLVYGYLGGDPLRPEDS